MRVWICTDHDGHYPVGVASVIVAQDEKQAFNLMDAALVDNGLKPHKDDPYTLREISLNDPVAYILNNGDY